MTKNIVTPNQFSEWLKEHLQTSTDDNTIDLIPAPCGIGKSYSMTAQIGECLQNQNRGIILVTDEVERMRQYVNGKNNGYLGQYIERNRDRILVYEASNAKTERANLYRKQILILSTQRFFSLSRNEIIDLTSTYIPRRHIFIDERAPLSEAIRIDLSTFNDIDTALNQQLDNTATEKEWLVTQWRNLRQRYDNYMRKYEASHDDYELHLWHSDEDKHATINDEKFLHLVNETYATKLRRADNDILKKIRAVFQMVTDGALFISRRKSSAKSSNEYSNFFLVTLDHSDLLLNIGSKTVILDGTGNIDPVYDAWFMNRVDCKQFQRDLSKLTINLVDINTSRNAIAKAPATNQRLKAIIDYIRTIPKVDAVFTYGRGKSDGIAELDTVEREFYDAGFKTGHFGGLKGKNSFRDVTDIVQVGLNRIPDEYYLMMAIQDIFNQYHPERAHYGVANINHMAQRMMLRSVLADIEQNIFRGTIRNMDNQKQQTYTLIYKCKSQADKDGIEHNELAGLTEMIKERYEALGATVNIIDTPTTILKLKTTERKTKDGHQTPAQKITEYLDKKEQQPNQPFKLSALLDECSITRDQFKNAIKKNHHIKQRLDSIRTEKQGWYQFYSHPIVA